MEHRNPLLHGESDSKFITIGEIMLAPDPAKLRENSA